MNDKKFRTRECAEFFTFSLFTLHFSLIRRVRIFWKVIGKRDEVRSEVAFRGGEKHFYIEKHQKTVL